MNAAAPAPRAIVFRVTQPTPGSRTWRVTANGDFIGTVYRTLGGFFRAQSVAGIGFPVPSFLAGARAGWAVTPPAPWPACRECGAPVGPGFVRCRTCRQEATRRRHARATAPKKPLDAVSRPCHTPGGGNE